MEFKKIRKERAMLNNRSVKSQQFYTTEISQNLKDQQIWNLNKILHKKRVEISCYIYIPGFVHDL